jgi:hypothetical protein
MYQVIGDAETRREQNMTAKMGGDTVSSLVSWVTGDSGASFKDWTLPDILHTIHENISWLHKLSNLVRKAGIVNPNVQRPSVCEIPMGKNQKN